MQVGQVILVCDIKKIGGKRQEKRKSIRPAIVREILDNNKINVRLVSTIYVNKQFKPKSIEEARTAIKNNLKGILPHEKQYIILSPEKDGVLNFSYVYGNMYTLDLEVNNQHIKILKDNLGKPLVISDEAKIEIEEKEIEALIEGIIKQYKIEFNSLIKNSTIKEKNIRVKN